MTLIAVYQYKDVQPCFIVADGLLSNDLCEPSNKVLLPMRGFVTGEEIDKNSFVSGLAQKLTIINPKIALTWAGDLEDARKLFTDFYNVFKDDLSPTKIKIGNYISELESKYIGSCVLIGIAITADGKEIAFGLGDTKKIIRPKLKEFGWCLVSGTGWKSFIDIMQDGLRSTVKAGYKYKNNKLENAINDSMTNLHGLMLQEKYSLENIQDKFGGFYEIAWNVNGEYKKNTDILYGEVIYSLETNECQCAAHFYKYDAIDNISVLRTIAAIPREDKSVEVGHYTHIIEPIIKDLKTNEKSKINSLKNCDPRYGCKEYGLPDINAATLFMAVHVVKRISNTSNNNKLKDENYSISGLNNRDHIVTFPIIYNHNREDLPINLCKDGVAISKTLNDLILRSVKDYMKERRVL